MARNTSNNTSSNNSNNTSNNTSSNTPVEFYDLRRPFTITDSNGESLIDSVVLDLPKPNGRTQGTVVEFYGFLSSSQLQGMVAIKQALTTPNSNPDSNPDSTPEGNPAGNPTPTPTTEELISTFLVQCSYANNPTFNFQAELVKRFRVVAKACPEIVKFNDVPLSDLHYNSMHVVDLVNLAAAYSVNFMNT